MEYIFLLLWLASGVCLVAGLIAPNFLQRVYKREMTRKQNLLIYGSAVLVSLVLFGITAPDIEQQTEATTTAPQALEVTQSVEVATSSAEVMGTSTTNDGAYPVTRVIDGDTIEVTIDGEKKTVRYIGIDTPETVHPSKPVECFGTEASNKNKELVSGKSVRLVKDVSETDKYGRQLRYVYVDDTFINLTLVQEGYAHASSYPPDVAYNEAFRDAEREARDTEKGLWGPVCKTQTVTPTPAITTETPGPETVNATDQCTIKGNISSSGEKIYHVAGCGSYSKTVIDVSKGERWFCTEKEALDAGWRKALNC